MINKRILLVIALVLLFYSQHVFAAFMEDFENSNFSSRGWYDNTNPVLSRTETAPGSTSSVEFRFLQGATIPVRGGAMRRLFTGTDSVYVSYYVKYSSNWQGSNRNYHPHEFGILTTKDGSWIGPAYSHLTAYIEQNALRPLLGIQDGRNIDNNNIGNNLVGKTENRSVAGCNGDSDGFGNGSCYRSGTVYFNGKSWMTNTPQIIAGKWHKVEAYFKLNSVVNGKGVADGILKYWLDGRMLIDHNNVMYRTGQHPDMKFNQFAITPYIGDCSPIEQTFWIDNLVLSTSPPSVKQPAELASPTNLRIQ
jgi:hypothetical protein